MLLIYMGNLSPEMGGLGLSLTVGLAQRTPSSGLRFLVGNISMQNIGLYRDYIGCREFKVQKNTQLLQKHLKHDIIASEILTLKHQRARSPQDFALLVVLEHFREILWRSPACR